MKKSYFLCLCLVAGAWAASLLGCKKEPCKDVSNPACENYDPCYGKKPVSAEFDILEVTANGNSIAIRPGKDTFIATYLQFVASEPNATYEWRIGSKIYTQQSFELNFSTAPANIPIYITLKVKKQPNQGCFPDDDGVDSITRRIVPMGYKEYAFHRYHGYRDNNPQDTFTFSIRLDSSTYETVFDNFHNTQCVTAGIALWNRNYHGFDFGQGEGTSNCGGPTGHLSFDPKQNGNRSEVHIDYTVYVSYSKPPYDFTRVKHTFTGYQLPK